MFFDSENAGAAKATNSIEHYILWLTGIVLVSSCFGFVIGIGAFIFAFLLTKARLGWLRSLLGAAAFILFLGVLSDRLTLRYPEGLLQTELKIQLPWPLQ